MKNLFVLLLATITVACAAEPEQPVSPEVRVLKDIAHPLQDASDLDPLLNRIGDVRLVLLGEASHGTSEFYTWRADISRRLIEEKGFRIVAVEGDWATLLRLNRYVKGLEASGTSAREIMKSFDRWPQWMWANEETAELIEWMREFNKGRPFSDRAGFYGIDVYGEDTAKQELIQALREKNAELEQAVAEAYACVDPYDGNLHTYARAVAMGATSCAVMVERAFAYMQEALEQVEGEEERYAFFKLKQKARVIKNAERHYRLMAMQGPQSWNARVDHFYATVDRLLAWHGPESRAVVWAHNTHIGDARASAMGNQGQRNIGQIAREERGARNVVAVGFGTHRGTVQAGRSWGAPMETMTVPPGREGSAEDWMHAVGLDQALFIFNEASNLEPLMNVVGHRAMGVIYHPEREHLGNYVPTILPRRYDAFIFIDETQALTPVS